MIRRYWPAALATVAVLVFGSYLAYTQFLSRRIQRDVELMMRIYSEVQAAIGEAATDASVDPQTPEGAAYISAYITALSPVQVRLQELGVPVVVVDAQGTTYAWMNVPDVADYPGGPGDRERARAYADELAERYPDNVMVTPISTLRYGKHPLLRWLDWVPGCR